MTDHGLLPFEEWEKVAEGRMRAPLAAVRKSPHPSETEVSQTCRPPSPMQDARERATISTTGTTFNVHRYVIPFLETREFAMPEDEKAIRQVVETWMTASRRGDTATVLDLMTDDVIFMVPGQEPFGKEAFAKASQSMSDAKLEGTSEILELQVLSDWAFIRNRLDITIIPLSGEHIHKSGYTLTLLRKEADGNWRLARDANLLTVRS